jgi:hypothetical protein
MDDLLPDFLVIGNYVNVTLNDTSLPDAVHSSHQGEIEPVSSVTTISQHSSITVT